MRAFIISPTKEPLEDTGTNAALDMIVEIVLKCLRKGGDHFQYSVYWADPGSELEGAGTFQEDIAVPHLVELKNKKKLRIYLRNSIDPFLGEGGGSVRSAATCRTVTFGFDGQALLLLRSEDDPPTTSEYDLVSIEECSDLISESDYFDGHVRPSK